MCSAPPNGCRETQHPTWSIKIRDAFQWGSGGWEAKSCTWPGVLLRYMWGLCSMSCLICMIFCCGSDCMWAYFFMSTQVDQQLRFDTIVDSHTMNPINYPGWPPVLSSISSSLPLLLPFFFVTSVRFHPVVVGSLLSPPTKVIRRLQVTKITSYKKAKRPSVKKCDC